MARSALQWLPSALRSGLLVLAAFSPLVAYSAGACVRVCVCVCVCVYACALFSNVRYVHKRTICTQCAGAADSDR